MDIFSHDADPGPATRLWAEPHHEHDMMSTRLLGFWLYMLSDSLIFAALFAAYGVLTFPNSFAGGPTARDVASPIEGYIETVVLFSSVFAYGIAMVELKRDREKALLGWLAVSFVIGIAFMAMEWHELAGLIARGATPERSGFLSIYFTLIVAHGVHLAFGLLWMVVMFAQVSTQGFTQLVTYRLANLKIYWLYQGLIWTFVYTFVYLRGSI